MSTDPILDSDEARSLVRQLSLMTGEAGGAVLTNALREQLRRTIEMQRHRPWTDPADVLARALAANTGRGIPENHCWGDAETRLAE